jgi:hypothetical protein
MTTDAKPSISRRAIVGAPSTAIVRAAASVTSIAQAPFANIPNIQSRRSRNSRSRGRPSRASSAGRLGWTVPISSPNSARSMFSSRTPAISPGRFMVRRAAGVNFDHYFQRPVYSTW